MWSAWIHLMVVHIPVILTPVAIFFLIRAARSSSSSAADFKFAYGVVLIVALAGIAAYVTGPIAADWLAEEIALAVERTEDHAVWGRAAFTVTSLAGAASLVALISYAQEEDPHPWIPRVVVVLMLIAFGLLLWTAHLGGLIRRPELGF